VQIGPSSSNALTNSYGYRDDSYGVPLLDIRYSQLQALMLPRVGMASAIDLGDPGCKAGIGGCMGKLDDNGLFGGHPRAKQPVGRRLSNLALSMIYNRTDLGPTNGPVIVGTPAPSGGTIALSFAERPTALASTVKVQFANTTMCDLFGEWTTISECADDFFPCMFSSFPLILRRDQAAYGHARRGLLHRIAI